MSRLYQLVVFSLEGRGYALPLSQVQRVVHAVEAAPLPQAPEIVLGVISFAGRVIPVVDIRRRFRLPPREAGLYDHLLIAGTSRREIAFLADEVTGIIQCPEEEITAADQIVPGLEYLEGVLQLKDGLIFIHDLERFLSLEEEKALDDGLKGLR